MYLKCSVLQAVYLKCSVLQAEYLKCSILQAVYLKCSVLQAEEVVEPQTVVETARKSFVFPKSKPPRTGREVS